MTVDEILSIFRENSALLEGHFILSSGLHSDRYIQCALVLQHPHVAEQLCSELAAKLRDVGATAKIALGPTRATITGSVVDGPALDVEGWAPYPLECGIWLSPELS